MTSRSRDASATSLSPGSLSPGSLSAWSLSAVSPSALVRRGIENGFRSRVAGPDRLVVEERIFGAPGPRWFAQDDAIWRVHTDPAMFVGGVRALLVQTLHPLAMAGVAQHSDYREDPWGRLQRTSLYLSATTFGPVSEAEDRLRAIRRIHDRINGSDPVGRGYDANDPHLLAWVHCALVESFLTTYQWYGGSRLSHEDADSYVAQMGWVNEKLGVNGLPRSVAELQSRLAAFGPELEAGESARATIDYLLTGPDMPPHAKAAYRVLVGGAVASLPAWARSLVIERESRWRGGELDRRSALALTGAMRWAMRHPANRPGAFHRGDGVSVPEP